MHGKHYRRRKFKRDKNVSITTPLLTSPVSFSDGALQNTALNNDAPRSAGFNSGDSQPAAVSGPMQFNADSLSTNAQQIFFSDLDGTLLGNEDSLEAFNMYWMGYAFRCSAMLVYNTGRPLAYVEKLINRGHLLHAEYMICGNGNNIYHRGKLWEPC